MSNLAKVIGKVIIAIAIAVALAIILISLTHEDVQGEATKCIPATAEEAAEIRRMMGRGFDQAFQAQLGLLYKTALANYPTVDKQRQYTKTGIDHAVAAWYSASKAADAWEGCK